MSKKLGKYARQMQKVGAVLDTLISMGFDAVYSDCTIFRHSESTIEVIFYIHSATVYFNNEDDDEVEFYFNSSTFKKDILRLIKNKLQGY